jgi:tRNA pseudouridine32 synthase/23S rRNA pseudouridine746 synthase
MFKTIAEHPDFIIVDKAAGLNFHDEGVPGSGLFSLVKQYIQTQNNCNKLYPVHRLDKITSGLLIFAKSLSAAQIFNQLFNEHLIEKYYIAIADKKPQKKQGLIKGDMTKSRRGMFKLLRSSTHPAITQFFSFTLGGKQRLYLMKPHSGKTHQLRVALTSLGAPIIGDPLYYAHSYADRAYLHAYALKFNYLGNTYEFICPPTNGQYFLREEIIQRLKTLHKPWLLNWPRLK